MRLEKKVLFWICWVVALLIPSGYGKNLCDQLPGVWSGFYNDHTRIYPAKLPVRITLNYRDGILNGYPIKQKSQQSEFLGARYMALGQCKNGKINLYFFAYYPNLCGCQSTGKITSQNKIKINVCWETAMMNGRGNMILKKKKRIAVRHKKMIPFPIQNKIIRSCH